MALSYSNLRRLRHDCTAGERIGPTLITAVAFIGVGILLLGVMNQVFYLAEVGGSVEDLEGWEYIGGRLIDMNTVTPADGYDVTPADVAGSGYFDGYRADEGTVFVFNDPALSPPKDMNVKVVRDNIYYHPGAWLDKKQQKYRDMIIVQSWRGWDYKYSAISYQTIASKFSSATNMSMVDFKMKSEKYTLIVNITVDWEPVPDQRNQDYFIERLWGNDFHVSIGIPAFTDDPDLAKESMWAMIWQALTMDLPGVPAVIQPFITIPFWIAIGFCAFTLVSRVIPFIAGG